MASPRSKVLALGLAAALSMVPLFEGTVLKRYVDPLGIPTDCTGHTGSDVKAVNTPEGCQAKLAADLLVANSTVDSCTHVPLTPNQRSAFVSFAFNVGPGGKGRKDGFCSLKSGNSPSFLRKLNAGDYTGACNGLMDWTMPGTVVHNGLLRRRTAERDLCLQR